jgi:hypothetical protein
MLVACRLAGLSALVFDYAVANVGSQSGGPNQPCRVRDGQALLDRPRRLHICSPVGWTSEPVGKRNR